MSGRNPVGWPIRAEAAWITAMVVEVAGALLVCGSLACAASAVLRRRARVAAALFAAALACAAAEQFGAGDALRSIACGLAIAGAGTMVVGRLGRPLALSWLDCVMGACAVGALAVTTGAELPANLAAAGVAERSGSRAGA